MLKLFVEKPRKNEQVLIALLWNNPSFYNSLKAHKISDKTFVDKSSYIYYKIGMLMFDTGLTNFDKVSVHIFLDKRPELKEEFELAGGYEDIQIMIDCLTTEDKSNLEYHINEILKFQALRELYENGLISKENKKHIETLMKASIDELRLYLNHQISNSLSNFNSSNYEIYDLIDANLYSIIDNARKGVQGSIPFYNASRLTKITKGWQLGKLYYLIMPSGLGKSTFARNIFLPSIIETKQNTLIFINEEDKDSWQLNLLVTIANMKIKEGVVFKERIMQGGFSEEERNILRKAADWLIENQGDFIIKIVSLKSYKFADVVRILEEFRPYGINTVILDTFKPTTSRNNGNSSMQRWEEFAENSQELYDLIKKENMNIRCLATAQMKIGYRDRYIGLDSTGKSKEIVEVGDVVMLCREVFADEFPGGVNEIKVYKYKKNENYEDGSNEKKWEKIEVELDINKKYIIMFFGKNRCGTDREQTIYEIDYERNLVYEVGFTELRQTSG